MYTKYEVRVPQVERLGSGKGPRLYAHIHIGQNTRIQSILGVK